MAVNYIDTLENITPAQLSGGFFDGWPHPPSPETHLKMLHGSYAVVLALDGEKVVGFITAISDGVLAAFIPLLEVLPDYKGQGIGTELTRRMVEKLRHLYAIDLICDANIQPFYERLGMQRYTGMIYRNYDRQSGA